MIHPMQTKWDRWRAKELEKMMVRFRVRNLSALGGQLVSFTDTSERGCYGRIRAITSASRVILVRIDKRTGEKKCDPQGFERIVIVNPNKIYPLASG